jgi:predicted RNase H-like HicB family nuclease
MTFSEAKKRLRKAIDSYHETYHAQSKAHES